MLPERAKLGITQAEYAKIVGCTQAYISYLECGAKHDPIKIREAKRKFDAQKNGYKCTPLERSCPTKPDKCELCGRLPRSQALNLDHDHDTGKFRGWLCGPCNKGLGALGDNEKGLERALKYLRRYK